MSRLFVATDLSIATVEKLRVVQREIDDRVGDAAQIRWVDPPNVHVTLKFLGEVDPAMVQLLDEKLTALARPLFPFEVTCGRLGAFPDLHAPRVVWAGLDEKGAEVMGLLNQSIERDLADLGFAPEGREYLAHVTLGRVRSRTRLDLEELTDDIVDLEFGTSYIKDIALFQSELASEGARYTVLRRYPLGEA